MIREYGKSLYADGRLVSVEYSPPIAKNRLLIIVKSPNSYTPAGRLETDIASSIISGVKFQLNEFGCQRGEVSLFRPPDFCIDPFSLFEIYVNGNIEYSGELQELPAETEAQPKYKLEGYFRYLKQWNAAGPASVGTLQLDSQGVALDIQASEIDVNNLRFGGRTEVTAAVRAIAEIAIQRFATDSGERGQIVYVPDKIDTATADEAKPLSGDIALGKYKLDKVFDIFARMMGNWQYGVDERREFYFRRPLPFRRAILARYDLQKYDTGLNTNTLKNVITVQRKQQTGSSGFTVAGIFNNTQSVAEYGRQELNYQVPGYFTDDDCRIVGEALAEAGARPRRYLKVKDAKWDRYVFGLYKFFGERRDNEYVNVLKQINPVEVTTLEETKSYRAQYSNFIGAVMTDIRYFLVKDAGITDVSFFDGGVPGTNIPVTFNGGSGIGVFQNSTLIEVQNRAGGSGAFIIVGGFTVASIDYSIDVESDTATATETEFRLEFEATQMPVNVANPTRYITLFVKIRGRGDRRYFEVDVGRYQTGIGSRGDGRYNLIEFIALPMAGKSVASFYSPDTNSPLSGHVVNHADFADGVIRLRGYPYNTTNNLNQPRNFTPRWGSHDVLRNPYNGRTIVLPPHGGNIRDGITQLFWDLPSSSREGQNYDPRTIFIRKVVLFYAVTTEERFSIALSGLPAVQLRNHVRVFPEDYEWYIGSAEIILNRLWQARLVTTLRGVAGRRLILPLAVVSDSTRPIFILRGDLVTNQNETYDLQLTRRDVNITPRQAAVGLEFGQPPPVMENFVAGLLATASELKFDNEDETTN